MDDSAKAAFFDSLRKKEREMFAETSNGQEQSPGKRSKSEQDKKPLNVLILVCADISVQRAAIFKRKLEMMGINVLNSEDEGSLSKLGEMNNNVFVVASNKISLEKLLQMLKRQDIPKNVEFKTADWVCHLIQHQQTPLDSSQFSWFPKTLEEKKTAQEESIMTAMMNEENRKNKNKKRVFKTTHASTLQMDSSTNISNNNNNSKATKPISS